MAASVLRESRDNKSRTVACFTTLLLIGKVRPAIITPYVKALHPYLNIKMKHEKDVRIVVKTEKERSYMFKLNFKFLGQFFLSIFFKFQILPFGRFWNFACP